MEKRWYDTNKRLAAQLDSLVDVLPERRYDIIKGVMDIIHESDPSILNKFEVPSDIEQWCRRWYDHEPVFWIVLNGLKFAREPLLQKIVDYLEEQLGDTTK